MKKFLSLILIINLLAAPVQLLFADTLSDTNDTLNIISPKPNQKVGGNVSIEWQSFDDDQTAIPYYVQLFDGATCKTTNYGRLNESSSALSSSTQNNKVSWDSTQKLSVDLGDGQYCIQICSAFKDAANYYSACNQRIVTVVNKNQLPTITSIPTILTINNNEPWQYQINANDKDEDVLRYYLIYAPDFLQIDNVSGVISARDGANRLPDGMSVAEYRVVVAADDQISGITTQEFTLRIEKDKSADNSNPNLNTLSQISFTTPKENDALSGTQNFVEWSAYDPDGVKEITLSYSKDLTNWTELFTNTDLKVSKYSWDVSSIDDGSYYLQLKVKDNQNAVIAKTSKVFTVKNNTEEIPTSGAPLIINVKPENEKELDSAPQTITGDFATNTGMSIDKTSFKAILNSNDITTLCVATENNFSCSLKDITEGSYQLELSVKDNSGETGTYSSSFFVKQSATSFAVTQSNSNSINLTGIIIAVIVIIIILVLIPYLLISGSKKKKSGTPQVKTIIQPIAPTTDFNLTPKENINNTFENVSEKVSNFNPQPNIPVPSPSNPVALDPNQTLGKNIEMAYSGGVANNTPQENFVEPQTADNLVAPAVNQPNTEYVAPAEIDNKDEDLRKMYPELYANPTNPQPSTDSEYVEPATKD